MPGDSLTDLVDIETDLVRLDGTPLQHIDALDHDLRVKLLFRLLELGDRPAEDGVAAFGNYI
jgi:hypothetical protein